MALHFGLVSIIGIHMLSLNWIHIQSINEGLSGVSLEIYPAVVQTGGTVEFECTYPGMEYNQDINITWFEVQDEKEIYIFKHDIAGGKVKRPVFNEDVYQYYQDRLEVHHHGSMTLSNIQSEDKTEYLCKIETCHPSRATGKASIMLTVINPTTITLLPSNTMINATTTSLVINIKITFDVRLPISVEWFHNKKPIIYSKSVIEKMDNHSLFINCTNMTEEEKLRLQGEYMVKVHNEYSKDMAVAVVDMKVESTTTIHGGYVKIPGSHTSLQNQMVALWIIVPLVFVSIPGLACLIKMLFNHNRDNRYQIRESSEPLTNRFHAEK